MGDLVTRLYGFSVGRYRKALSLSNGGFTVDDWPFDQPPNCAVISICQITDGYEPILHVTHDSDDHGWQFLGCGDARVEDAVVLSFRHVVDMDRSIRDLADLPPGWHAW